MTALAPPVPHQRSRGGVVVRTGPHGLIRLREEGSAKARFPHGGSEAILINTGGGLAGGDRFKFDIGTETGGTLSVTTQAAERVYGSLGPAAEVEVVLSVAAGSALSWLPQESILYESAALSRRISADLGPGARLLAAESVILGRAAMGEVVTHVSLADRWRIRREGRLIFADDLVIVGAPPASRATLGEARAFATLVLVAEDAETLVEPARLAIGSRGSASAWSGKLVARLVARDGFELRKALIPALTVLAEGKPLPKIWSL